MFYIGEKEDRKENNITIRLCKLRNIMRDGQASSNSGFGRLFAFVINLSFFSVNLDASNFSAS